MVQGVGRGGEAGFVFSCVFLLGLVLCCLIRRLFPDSPTAWPRVRESSKSSRDRRRDPPGFEPLRACRDGECRTAPRPPSAAAVRSGRRHRWPCPTGGHQDSSCCSYPAALQRGFEQVRLYQENYISRNHTAGRQHCSTGKKMDFETGRGSRCKAGAESCLVFLEACAPACLSPSSERAV